MEDGAKTLTVFSANIIIADQLSNLISKDSNVKEFLICGGGRKNSTLLHEISKRFSDNISFKLIDDYGLNGDFIESQAFAFRNKILQKYTYQLF